MYLIVGTVANKDIVLKIARRNLRVKVKVEEKQNFGWSNFGALKGKGKGANINGVESWPWEETGWYGNDYNQYGLFTVTAKKEEPDVNMTIEDFPTISEWTDAALRRQLRCLSQRPNSESTPAKDFRQ